MKRMTVWFVLVHFCVMSLMPGPGFAQALSAVGLMPAPGIMVNLTGDYTPAYLWGMSIHPNDPFKFDFLIHRGDAQLSADQKQDEYAKLIKYFLAALAIPDSDQWVNLSPYEKDRIIPEDFGLTEMGRDLLAQDYLLKQLASSLTNPDSNLGEQFWARVYERAYQEYGTTDIPTDTFNKVWIMPDKAVIFEKNNAVHVLENHLKVMTDKDYLAMKNNASGQAASEVDKLADITSDVLKEVLLPVIEKEVNEGKSFAPLRQVYSGMLLATWYKRTLKESILGKLYADKGKVKGVDQDPKSNQEIFEKYVQAFRKGVFNMIKEDVDRYSQELIPRKYFSGGTIGFGNEDRSHIVRATPEAHGAVVTEEKEAMDFVEAQIVDAAENAKQDAGSAIKFLGREQRKALVRDSNNSVHKTLVDLAVSDRVEAVLYNRAQLQRALDSGDVSAVEYNGTTQFVRSKALIMKGGTYRIEAGQTRLQLETRDGRAFLQRYDDGFARPVGKPFPIVTDGKPYVVGRNGGIRIDDPSLSNIHFQLHVLEREGELYVVVVDLGSLNGTTVTRLDGGIDKVKDRVVHEPAYQGSQKTGESIREELLRTANMDDLEKLPVNEAREVVRKLVLQRNGQTGINLQARGQELQLTTAKGSSQYYEKVLVRAVEKALNLMFAENTESVIKSLASLSVMWVSNEGRGGYHMFETIPAKQAILGQGGIPRMDPQVKRYFLANSAAKLKEYIDGDVMRDVIRGLGAKRKRLSIVQILQEYLTLVYQFETATSSAAFIDSIKRMVISDLPDLMYGDAIGNYKFSKAVDLGRAKVFSQGNIFLDEAEPVSLLDGSKGYTVVSAGEARSYKDFKKFVDRQSAEDKDKNFYIFHKVMVWDGRKYIMAARNGRLEIYYSSTTYSKIAGQEQWSRQEGIKGEKEGDRDYLWHAKPLLEVAHDVTDIASLKISQAIARLQTENLTNDQLKDLHLDLGLLFDYQGVMMSRAKDGRIQRGNALNLRIDYGRYSHDVLYALGMAEHLPSGDGLELKVLNQDDKLKAVNSSLADNAQMEESDKAMNDKYGGIDFAQSHLDLQIRRDGSGVVLPVSLQNLENIRIDGLVPVILSIQPATTAQMIP